MNNPSFRNWQSVQEEVLRRIHARVWTPGNLIPNEADLALEFGCARTTVNRALRSLAESGLLDRRRKAGTRVAAQPVAKATLDITVIRIEIEDRGQKYGYQRIERGETVPPLAISGAMKTHATRPLLHVRALHMVPKGLAESYETVSANEWLLKHAPYTHGEIAFSATSATSEEAGILCCNKNSALLTIDRLTWDGSSTVTKVRLLFEPGHQLRTNL
jgi:GntR family histidine utilization transcriptional repressor